MSWISIPKPTSSTYTAVNFQGKEQYDQSSLTYDDSSTYYDGVNSNAYTNVAKPTSSTWTIIAKPN